MSDVDVIRRWVWRVAQFGGVWTGFALAWTFDWGEPDAINMAIGVGIWTVILTAIGVVMDLDARRAGMQP